MEDVKNVIKGLHDVRRYLEDKEWFDKGASPHINAINDALKLLKEYAVVKESISDEIHETAKMFRRTEEDGWIERCDRRARQSLSD